MNNDYHRNVEYIFIPFIVKETESLGLFNKLLKDNRDWELQQDEIKYMFKFVSDKLNSNDDSNCQCFHYKLSENGFRNIKININNCFFRTTNHSFLDEFKPIFFRLLSVHLYVFSTSVGIMAYQISIDETRPLGISNALYYLKKVSKEEISIKNNSTNFLEMSKRILDRNNYPVDLDFFYYANEGTDRANILTLLEVEPQDNYNLELYYLRHCYGEGFLYSENKTIDEEEIYIPSQDTIWGISPEAAVCLIRPDLGRSEFLKKVFYKNFNDQYLYMYVLLLHQKYVLYMFLTKIGIGLYNNLETLEEYKHQLYEFETDFVFSQITEVPQYQYLYERMSKAFSLKDMYDDVHEPLISLAEVRRTENENKQKSRDKSLNKSLITLSILSFFSALIDSFDFANSFFSWFVSGNFVKIIQILFIISIFVILIRVIISLRKNNEGD